MQDTYLIKFCKEIIRQLKLGCIGGGIEGLGDYLGEVVVGEVQQRDVGAVLEGARLDLGQGVVGYVDGGEVQVFEGVLLYLRYLVG